MSSLHENADLSGISCPSSALFMTPVFNCSKCPAHHEMQLPHFFESGYDLHKNYPGMYYELAFHDILQVAYALDRCACSCLRLLAACACGITPTTSDFEWFANHSAPENEVSIP